MAERVLIVDDEESIVRLVSFNLKKEGYTVLEARDGSDAVSVIEAANPDLVLLDVMLPEMNGLDVFRAIRSRGKETPVIFLTARDSEIDRVLGLELGADDYITKPFSPRELTARVRAVLRRSTQPRPNSNVSYGDLMIDRDARTVEVGGEPVNLTAKEFDLLSFLAQNPGKVFTRETLLDRVWGYEYAGDTRIVDVHVSHLREKIEEDPKSPAFVKTVRGIGYKFGEKTR
ncbi:MAG: response regulator transcription factor [Firmicutes bacterium]|nr:response regulator transcription factor [Bacillota bacterium]